MGEAGGANLRCYVKNLPLHRSDIRGLCIECCPEKLMVYFDSKTTQAEAQLAQHDEQNTARWESLPEEIKQRPLADPALSPGYKGKPYPHGGEKRQTTKSPYYGYWGDLWDGTLTVVYKGGACKRTYEVQAGGRASKYEGKERNNTTAPVAGSGYVNTNLDRGRMIVGFSVRPEAGGDGIWYDNRSEIKIHLAPLFVPAVGTMAEIRQRGSHGCISLKRREDWHDLEKRLKACKGKKIKLKIDGIKDYPRL